MNDFFNENFNISKIVACVYVPAGRGASSHRNRKWHGLVVQTDGIKEYKFRSGEVLKTEAGDVFYLPKFSDYDITDIKQGSCIAINFELYDEKITYPPFVDKNSTMYLHNFKKLYKAWQTKNAGYMNVCYKYLYEIICDIQAQNTPTYVPTNKAGLIEQAVDIINNNIGNSELTVSELSSKAGISPEYFRSLFKKVYNQSPRKYIINLRISKAIDLMSLKKYKINEIAELCGFNDATYFSTEFKKITNYSPADYIKHFFN